MKVNVAAADLNDDADDALYGHDDDRQAAVLGGHPGPVPEQKVGLRGQTILRTRSVPVSDS